MQDYPDRAALAAGVARVLADALRAALGRRETVALAVPGGTTPGPVFDALSGADLDWGRVAVLPTDERDVPPDHPRSNARLIRERLLVGPAAAARLVPLDPAAVAPLLPLDVVLLGMGTDGHVASLFPGADRLADALAADAPAVLRLTAPGAPEPRLSLTSPVLAAARSAHLLITGAEKRAVLDRARQPGPVAALPVRAVLPGLTVHYAE
ncbi:MAG TPA: 6-phosphogluconolactonase [Rhodobacteraceae bacterium]|jgi:6-phosphogluconolactonase|nr:6-phosphogluconolactonase [Paracoccaceae bacterium]HBG98667.1 6-phosphogluconolactonase [Paracoccaceae bacterium]